MRIGDLDRSCEKARNSSKLCLAAHANSTLRMSNEFVGIVQHMSYACTKESTADPFNSFFKIYFKVLAS